MYCYDTICPQKLLVSVTVISQFPIFEALKLDSGRHQAMILCGMARNTNGRWEFGQLKPVLQNIVQKHKAQFENPDADDGDY